MRRLSTTANAAGLCRPPGWVDLTRRRTCSRAPCPEQWTVRWRLRVPRGPDGRPGDDDDRRDARLIRDPAQAGADASYRSRASSRGSVPARRLERRRRPARPRRTARTPGSLGRRLRACAPCTLRVFPTGFYRASPPEGVPAARSRARSRWNGDRGGVKPTVPFGGGLDVEPSGPSWPSSRRAPAIIRGRRRTAWTVPEAGVVGRRAARPPRRFTVWYGRADSTEPGETAARGCRSITRRLDPWVRRTGQPSWKAGST